MKLYLIRHGESEANRQRRHSGWEDVHLTEKGIVDAQRAGKFIAGINFDKIFSSDLVRVKETCFYATGIKEPEIHFGLREMSVGSLMGKRPLDLMNELGEEYASRYKVRDYRIYGGENMEDLMQRVSGFMKMLEEEPYQGMDNILAFTSEGPIAMALSYVLGINKLDMFRYASCSNGAICVFEFLKGKWILRFWNYLGSL